MSLCFSSVVVAQGLKVTNLEHNGSTYKLELYYTDYGNCSPNREIHYVDVIKNFRYEDSMQASSKEPAYLCVLGSSITNWFYTAYPLRNTPECEIQIFQGDFYGLSSRARASKACEYKEDCIDGREYTYKDRHLSVEGTPEYDAFEKLCLPYEVKDPY